MHYKRRGKTTSKMVVNIGTIELQPNSRRLTGHFYAKPTSGWGWNFFGLPLGVPPPELPPERPQKREQEQPPPPAETDFWGNGGGESEEIF